jgi:threonine 3-dehydrogenase
MKAIAKTRPAPGAELIETPVPRPGEGELLVKVAACGICGSDLHIYEWELGAERAVGSLPAVLGHEPAGEVVEVGARVRSLRPVRTMRPVHRRALQLLRRADAP